MDGEWGLSENSRGDLVGSLLKNPGRRSMSRDMEDGVLFKKVTVDFAMQTGSGGDGEESVRGSRGHANQRYL